MTEISKPNLLAVKSSPIKTEFGEQELERRLSLYQVFLKLYEHHSSLLDEILQLENVSQPSLLGLKPHYLQGIVDGSAVYVITNLCEGKTLSLRQPQQIWTIGRSRASGIYVCDKHLSRRHAAIQYIDPQGFYLIDFNSTNGSYLNGEPIYKARKLKDGDRIRLGSITFSFFTNHTTCVLPNVAVDLLLTLAPRMADEVEKIDQVFAVQKSLTQDAEIFTEIVRGQDTVEDLAGTSAYEYKLCNTQQSDILDSFMHIKPN